MIYFLQTFDSWWVDRVIVGDIHLEMKPAALIMAFYGAYLDLEMEQVLRIRHMDRDQPRELELGDVFLQPDLGSRYFAVDTHCLLCRQISKFFLLPLFL